MFLLLNENVKLVKGLHRKQHLDFSLKRYIALNLNVVQNFEQKTTFTLVS